MRLRYLALPEYGPLRDLRIVFGRETVLPDRVGSLNFIVGVNGTGKSHLFRALFEIFRHLESSQLPPFGVALVYDLTQDRTSTKKSGSNGSGCRVIFHHNPQDLGQTFFCYRDLNADEAGKELSRSLFEQELAALQTGTAVEGMISVAQNHYRLIRSAEILGRSGDVNERLPQNVLAYTSGSLIEWEKLGTRWQPYDTLPEHFESPNLYDERSLDWNTRLELSAADAEWRDEPLSSEDRQKYRTGLMQRETADGSCQVVCHNGIRIAAAAFGVWQAARDFRLHATESQRDAFRSLERQALAKKERGSDARRIFRSVDWLWATHVSLVLDPAQRIPQLATDELWFCLHALADRVIQLPNGLCQFVIQLAPNERADLSNTFSTWFLEMGDLPSGLGAFMTNTAGSVSGAETLVRLFSGTNLESGLLPFFTALREWRREGFLERASITIRRISRDDVLCLESFSDGEQMLLGRAALLFLLRKQSDSLLLLDEPETHFNDAWKREIVDWVDEYVLRETPAQVLISTHTSIALTDAFAPEIAVFQKPDETSVIHSVAGGTFGTDPSEIMTNLFGAESGIGSRSLRRLDALLKYPWSVHEIEKLEQILTTLGSSFHRAELRAKLAELKDQKAHGAA